MAQPSARRTALAALRGWRSEKRFADSVITKLLAQTELDLRDRAFALELFSVACVSPRSISIFAIFFGSVFTSSFFLEHPSTRRSTKRSSSRRKVVGD